MKNTSLNVKTVVITGVTGQDGSFMAELLVKQPDYIVYGAVRRVSNPNYKYVESLLELPNFKLIELDVTDSENVTSVISTLKPNYYINLAANSFVGNSWTMPLSHLQTNTLGVLYALEAIKKFSPETAFYNAGSSEQFGNVDYVPQDYQHPFKPRSPYGASKCAAHHLVKVYRESYNLYAVQGILFNHEGPRRGEEFVTRKITKGVARIKKAIDQNLHFEPISLGNVHAKRDWSDAEDFVEGIWLMLNQPTPKDFVLASGEAHTIKEFVEIAFNCIGIKGVWVGKDLNEKYVSLNGEILIVIDEMFYRPAEVDLLLGDSKLAKQELNWTPKTSFKELVSKMVKADLL